LIELRQLDGSTVVDEYEHFTTRTLVKGDLLAFKGHDWVFRDRVDREGVPVYMFTPLGSAERLVYETEQLRKRAGSSY
jgi:hypothetical protein